MKARSPFLLCLGAVVCLSTIGLPLAAQQPAGFADRPRPRIETPLFSDLQVSRLITTLDGLLAPAAPSMPWGETARAPLWDFARRLQDGRMTPRQETQVLAHLSGIARAHPDAAAVVDDARDMVRSLTIGKTAPDIVGKDMNGADLRLADYRGKVVVIVFGADWCGICRTLYPYERLMLELYRNWPLAILGVETGANREAVKQTMTQERLAYPAWWDAPEGDDGGAIATAWHVGGFPTLYVLDGKGVIRFVDLRDEDLLKGVHQLLSEIP